MTTRPRGSWSEGTFPSPALRAPHAPPASARIPRRERIIAETRASVGGGGGVRLVGSSRSRSGQVTTRRRRGNPLEVSGAGGPPPARGLRSVAGSGQVTLRIAIDGRARPPGDLGSTGRCHGLHAHDVAVSRRCRGVVTTPGNAAASSSPRHRRVRHAGRRARRRTPARCRPPRGTLPWPGQGRRTPASPIRPPCSHWARNRSTRRSPLNPPAWTPSLTCRGSMGRAIVSTNNEALSAK